MKSSAKDDLRKAYNKKAEERDASMLEDWKAKERQSFLHMLREEKCGTLLEIGAGPGKDSLYFKEMGLRTFSTDFSPEMVRMCKEKGLEAAVMDFGRLDIPDSHYDSIWALNCLLHVPKAEMDSVLSEIRRVLKPSGLFYMGVYGGMEQEGVWEEDTYEPKRFFSFYKEEPLLQLISDAFHVEYFHVVPKEEIGGNLAFFSAILRK